VKKFFKYGCLSIAAIFVLLTLYFIFEPEDIREARIKSMQADRDSAFVLAEKVRENMALVRRNLPVLSDTTVPSPFPASSQLDWSSTLQTSVQELEQYQDSVFLKKNLSYGPWLSQPLQDLEPFMMKTQEYIDHYKVRRAVDEILRRKYLMVYAPVFYDPPRITDKEHFIPGVFYGWMILVDRKSAQPLGYTRFQAFNTLTNIETYQLTVGVGPVDIPVTDGNFQEQLNKNFADEFFRKTDSVFRSNRAGI
jgi:hypothetical protein